MTERGESMKNNMMVNLRGVRSLHEIARELGIPYSTYAMIETGRRFPRKELAMKISKFYGVTIDELFFSQNGHETRPNTQTA